MVLKRASDRSLKTCGNGSTGCTPQRFYFSVDFIERSTASNSATSFTNILSPCLIDHGGNSNLYSRGTVITLSHDIDGSIKRLDLATDRIPLSNIVSSLVPDLERRLRNASGRRLHNLIFLCLLQWSGMTAEFSSSPRSACNPSPLDHGK
jgi:hypothetical protein